MDLPKDRQALVQQLAAASLTGTLGLFIGSGFSKALTNSAPTWGQLLRRAASGLGLSDPLADPTEIVGQSFPRIASEMVLLLDKKLATDDSFKSVSPGQRRQQAVRRLKMEVSRQTTLSADTATRQKYCDALRALHVAWVITTNYDFLVEEVIDHSETLLPGQVLRTRRGCVPVFHVHGHMLHPDSIVLLEEDYVSALDHSAYRHLRLGVLFAESTTLMLGYALGDVNVQTALSYGGAYHSDSTEMRAGDVGSLVFLNRTDSVAPDPRPGAWGETIVDSTDIIDFLEEIRIAREALGKKWDEVRAHVEAISSNSDGIGSLFVTDAGVRQSFITAAQEIPALLSAELLVQIVQRSLGPEAKKAYASGGWAHYKPWLDAVIDVLIMWPLGTMSPQLFEYLAGELQTLARCIDPKENGFTKGFAWDATNLWHSRKQEVLDRPELMKTLRTYAERKRASSLQCLLGES